MAYADVSKLGAQRGSDAAVRPVAVDLTRPIKKKRLWIISGSDLTPVVVSQVSASARPIVGLTGTGTRDLT